MSFKKHDSVWVKSLRRDGVVISTLKDGTIQVAIGTLVVKCQEADLQLTSEAKKGVSRHHSTRIQIPRPEAQVRRDQSLSVDLHGMRVEEAMRLVEKMVDQAILADCERLEVIHGVGRGRIMDALHRYLTTLSVVKHFKLAEGNPGTTWVYF